MPGKAPAVLCFFIMNIIEDLEPTARGVYTGCIGYIDGNVTLHSKFISGKDILQEPLNKMN